MKIRNRNDIDTQETAEQNEPKTSRFSLPSTGNINMKWVLIFGGMAAFVILMLVSIRLFGGGERTNEPEEPSTEQTTDEDDWLNESIDTPESEDDNAGEDPDGDEETSGEEKSDDLSKEQESTKDESKKDESSEEQDTQASNKTSQEEVRAVNDRIQKQLPHVSANGTEMDVAEGTIADSIATDLGVKTYLVKDGHKFAEIYTENGQDTVKLLDGYQSYTSNVYTKK